MTMTMPAPIISSIALDHIREMMALERDAHPASGRWSLEQFRDRLLQGDYARGIFVRDSRGVYRVAGFLIAEPLRRKYEILNLTIGVGCRRVGFGRRLVEELQQHCFQSEEPLRIEVTVSEWADDLIAFFRSLGFVGTMVRQPLMAAFNIEDDAIEFTWRPPVRRP